MRQIKKLIKKYLWLKPTALAYRLWPSTKPLSDRYGLDRGTPIDRFYIESFLAANQTSIQGRCLELLDNNYTQKYGGNKISQSDILDIDTKNKKATIIADLRQAQAIDDNTYDCIILTQVLQFIDEPDKAIGECYRILKPGGAILATLPSISRIDCRAGVDGDFWRFTEASAQFLFGKHFNSHQMTIKSEGNVLVGWKFWIGQAQEEVAKKALLQNDKNFPCIITVKATK